MPHNTPPLSPKRSIIVDVPMSTSEALSVVIQALTGAAGPKMIRELLVGCLSHVSGNHTVYDPVRRTYTVTSIPKKKSTNQELSKGDNHGDFMGS